MKKLFKNLKISTVVILMSLLAIVFTFVIGFSGYRGINLINSNGTEIYHNGVLPLSDASYMSSEFIKIRLNATKARYSYNAQYAEAIINSDKIIQQHYKNFIKTVMNDDEKAVMDSFINYYSEYMKGWNDWNNTLSKGGTVSDESYQKLAVIGVQIDDNLNKLMQKQITDVKVIDDQNDAIFKSKIRSFIITLIIVIVIFLPIACVVVLIINKSSKRMINNLNALSKGDFTIEIQEDRNNEFGLMDKALGTTVKNISDMIKVVKEKSLGIDNQSNNLYSVAEEMASSSENVANAIQDVAKGTSSQAEGLMVISNTLHNFSEELDNIVQSIEDVDAKSRGINSMANDSNIKMQDLIQSAKNVKSMFDKFETEILVLSKSINQVNDITNAINSIADQTNLLALNASIEAARAGEAGRGFTVVAAEIRKLAEQSKNSANSINNILNNVSNQTSDMVRTSDALSSEISSEINVINISVQSYRNIIAVVEEILPQIEGVNRYATIIDKQKDDIIEKIQDATAIAEEISASSEQIAASAQQMSASSQEVTATIQELTGSTNAMLTEAEKFKLKN